MHVNAYEYAFRFMSEVRAEMPGLCSDCLIRFPLTTRAGNADGVRSGVAPERRAAQSWSIAAGLVIVIPWFL